MIKLENFNNLNSKKESLVKLQFSVAAQPERRSCAFGSNTSTVLICDLTQVKGHVTFRCKIPGC